MVSYSTSCPRASPDARYGTTCLLRFLSIRQFLVCLGLTIPPRVAPSVLNRRWFDGGCSKPSQCGLLSWALRDFYLVPEFSIHYCGSYDFHISCHLSSLSIADTGPWRKHLLVTCGRIRDRPTRNPIIGKCQNLFPNPCYEGTKLLLSPSSTAAPSDSRARTCSKLR